MYRSYDSSSYSEEMLSFFGIISAMSIKTIENVRDL